LKGARLGEAVLTEASLVEADLRNARLDTADLSKARLDGANWNSGTSWPPELREEIRRASAEVRTADGIAMQVRGRYQVGPSTVNGSSFGDDPPLHPS
jgi:uncharacterized protein YjbI with pentapeptide repeats